nr:hypothetical protein GCM10020185_58740 [Pseudomonas brassicacearum subsp. brassicacearum]
MNVIQHFKPGNGQWRVGEQVHASTAHFVQRLGALAGIQQFDLDPQFLPDLRQQVGAGANQVLGVLRVLPEIGWCIRAAGGDQSFTFAGGDRQAWHERQRPQQRPAGQTTQIHGNTLL